MKKKDVPFAMFQVVSDERRIEGKKRLCKVTQLLKKQVDKK
jgi:hypothetical protein